MENISALGGQQQTVPQIVARQTRLSFGLETPRISAPGIAFEFGDSWRAFAVPLVPASWPTGTAFTTATHERFIDANLLSDGFRSQKTIVRIPTNQTDQELGGIASSRSDTVSARPNPGVQTETAIDRLPYASLIRGMLDQDQVASARTLLKVALGERPGDIELGQAAIVLAPPTSVRRAVTDRDRSAEYAWLALHGAEYRRRWVAIVGGELVGSGTSLKQLLFSLEQSGHKGRALIHLVA